MPREQAASRIATSNSSAHVRVRLADVNHHGAAPKKGMSGLTIALIVIGVTLVLAFDTCIGGGWYLGKQVKKGMQSIADGGLVLVAPPEVVAALEGEKKDYVGDWREKDGGENFININANGSISAQLKTSGGGTQKFTNLAIAAFQGDNIEVRLVYPMIIKVTKRPHQVGDRWEMTADGITFERVGTIGK